MKAILVNARETLFDPLAIPVKVIDVDGSLESLQRQVGGYIEVVYSRDVDENGATIIVNEEGKNGLPVNALMPLDGWEDPDDE